MPVWPWILNFPDSKWGPPLWLGGKESSCNAGATRDAGLIPGPGRSPGGEYGNPLQYSYLQNPMDRGRWWATAHEVTKSQTRLKWLSSHASTTARRHGSFCWSPKQTQTRQERFRGCGASLWVFMRDGDWVGLCLVRSLPLRIQAQAETS